MKCVPWVLKHVRIGPVCVNQQNVKEMFPIGRHQCDEGVKLLSCHPVIEYLNTMYWFGLKLAPRSQHWSGSCSFNQLQIIVSGWTTPAAHNQDLDATCKHDFVFLFFPDAGFGLRVLSLPAPVCLPVCLRVCVSINSELVRALNHHAFKPEPPNLGKYVKQLGYGPYCFGG